MEYGGRGEAARFLGKDKNFGMRDKEQLKTTRVSRLNTEDLGSKLVTSNPCHNGQKLRARKNHEQGQGRAVGDFCAAFKWKCPKG